jgi:hypothetical protein
MVTDPNNNLIGVAIGHKDAGSIVGAKDFCLTAFVEQKLTRTQLETNNIMPFERVFARAAGVKEQEVPPPPDMDVVETGNSFRVLPGLSAPASQVGQYGGNPPALNAQKCFWRSGLA